MLSPFAAYYSEKIAVAVWSQESKWSADARHRRRPVGRRRHDPGAARCARAAERGGIDTLFEQVKNWGRWGPADELGSVNLVTDAKRKQAVALVKAGVTVSLARNPLTERADDNTSPFEHTMLRGNNMDRYAVSYHGYAHSSHRCAVPHSV